MILTRKEYRYELTKKIQNFKDELYKFFEEKNQDFICEKSYLEAVACAQMYFSTQDSISQALRKLDYNF